MARQALSTDSYFLTITRSSLATPRFLCARQAGEAIQFKVLAVDRPSRLYRGGFCRSGAGAGPRPGASAVAVRCGAGVAHLSFAARLIDHEVASPIRAQKAGRRGYRRCSRSRDAPFDDEHGRLVERTDTLDQKDFLLRVDAVPKPEPTLTAAVSVRMRSPDCQIRPSSKSYISNQT